jgi:hypothetical protein
MRIVAIFIIMFAGACFLRADGFSSCGWDSYIGTNHYSFWIGSEVIDKTLVWQARDEQPPLAARKALRVARAELAKLFTDAAHWRLDVVSLSPLSESDGRWIYLVRFYPPLPPGGILEGHVEPMTIPVLMSGVAVEPEISIWSRK